jgi:hypothetical protein
MKISKPRTKMITSKQWDSYIPAKRMAKHFRSLARALDKAGPNVRAKAALQIEFAAEVKP